MVYYMYHIDSLDGLHHVVNLNYLLNLDPVVNLNHVVVLKEAKR
jgi:hypothetical protein